MKLFPFVVCAVLAASSALAQVEMKPDASAAAPKRGNARFYELHAQHLKRSQEGPIDLLFLGDSITERWARVPEVWNEYFGAYQAANFGIGGDQTQHLIWRIEDGILDKVKPKVVVILIGTNNTGQHSADEIAAANAKIVQLVQAKVPQVKIILMAIFPRESRLNRQGELIGQGEERMKIIRPANALLAKLADGDRVRFMDIGAKFLDANGKIPESVMPDKVHLSADGYRIWAEALKPVIAALMGEAKK